MEHNNYEFENGLKKIFLSCLLNFVFLAMILFLITVPVGAQEIMPLSEVKPGMECYGYSDFGNGEPEKFKCKVISIDDIGLGFYKGIFAEYYDGPKLKGDGKGSGKLLETTRIMQGMSGSPIYIDGRLVGSVMTSLVFGKWPQGLIMPIQYTFDFYKNSQGISNKWLSQSTPGNIIDQTPAVNGELVFAPGDSVAICFAWNDEGGVACANGTVITSRFENTAETLYVFGHSMEGLFNMGVMGAPIFKANTLTNIASTMISSKFIKTTGGPIGTAIFNGPFGVVGKLGVTAKSFELNIIVKNKKGETYENKVYCAYSKIIPALLQLTLKNAENLLDGSLDMDIDYKVRGKNTPDLLAKSKFWGAFLFPGNSGKKVDFFTLPDELLMYVGGPENLNPNVESIDIVLSQSETDYKTLVFNEKAVAEFVDEDKTKVSVTTFLYDEDGNEVNFKFLRKIDESLHGKKIKLSSGNYLANLVLNKKWQASPEVIKLLNFTQNRNNIYAYCEDCGSDDKATGKSNAHGLSSAEAWFFNKQSPNDRFLIFDSFEVPGNYVVLGNSNFTMPNPKEEGKDKETNEDKKEEEEKEDKKNIV